MPCLTVCGRYHGMTAIICKKSVSNSLESCPTQQRIHIEGQACIPLQCMLKMCFLYDSRCCNIIWNEKEDVKGLTMMDVSKNAERFMGYADVYHMARPRGPRFVVDCLINYLGYFPQTVVDLAVERGFPPACGEPPRLR